MSLDRLTPRQREVVQELLKGSANKVIAAELGIGVESVKDHLRTAMAHAGVSSRLQLALMASRQQQ